MRASYCFTFFLLSLVLVEVTVSRSTSKTSSELDVTKIIIDTDAGTDDAFAIFSLLRAEKYAQESGENPGLKIIGITTVSGNTHVENVCINVLRILKVVDRFDIPVYKGTSESILETPPPDNFYGQDGMGDVPDPDPPSPELLQKKHSVEALVDLVNENPGEVTLIAIGPLTNVALACRIDENFMKKLKRIVVMGGSVHGYGNIHPGVEFNFYVDPEAVSIVLNGTDTRNNVISILPWETTLEAKISMKWRKEVFGVLESSDVKFMNMIEHIEEANVNNIWQMADPQAAMMAVKASLIGRVESHGITAITQGPTRGGIAVDYADDFDYDHKTAIFFDLNVTLYLETLLKYFE